MHMHIQIDNRQRNVSFQRVALQQVIAELAALAAACRGARPWRDVTVILTDDAGIAPLNLQIMQHEGSTDVITQRYEALPGEPEGVIGELIVNVERAWQVGSQRRGWSAAQELALYIAHGCDHLNDAEDATPAGRRRMRQRELRWLARLGKSALLSVGLKKRRKVIRRKAVRQIG